MRILVANDPRSYRDVIAGVFRALFVDAEVIAVEPDELDAIILELDPQVIVCSTLTEAVETRIPAWVLLYPEGQGLAVLSIAGQRTRVEGIELDGLLTLVNQAKGLASAS